MARSAMERARQLIVEKRYGEAREVLEEIDHPTAKTWLAKLDEIAPVGGQVAAGGAQKGRSAGKGQAKTGRTPSKEASSSNSNFVTFALVLTLAALVLVVVIVLLMRPNTVTSEGVTFTYSSDWSAVDPAGIESCRNQENSYICVFYFQRGEFSSVTGGDLIVSLRYSTNIDESFNFDAYVRDVEGDFAAGLNRFRRLGDAERLIGGQTTRGFSYTFEPPNSGVTRVVETTFVRMGSRIYQVSVNALSSDMFTQMEPAVADLFATVNFGAAA